MLLFHGPAEQDRLDLEENTINLNLQELPPSQLPRYLKRSEVPPIAFLQSGLAEPARNAAASAWNPASYRDTTIRMQI